jgi:hypothetical protein
MFAKMFRIGLIESLDRHQRGIDRRRSHGEGNLPNTNKALALAFGVLIVTLIIAGSLWLMTQPNRGQCIK